LKKRVVNRNAYNNVRHRKRAMACFVYSCPISRVSFAKPHDQLEKCEKTSGMKDTSVCVENLTWNDQDSVYGNEKNF